MGWSMTQQRAVDAHGLKSCSLDGLAPDHWNAVTPALYEHAVRRKEGLVAHLGPLVVRTGARTGRSPRDKFVVREPGSEDQIWWEGNQPFDPDQFDRLHQKVLAYLSGREIFVQDCFAGADRRYRRSVRFITELAWQNLFVRNLFIHQPHGQTLAGEPDFTVIAAPNVHADPDVNGTHSEAFVLIHLGKRLILIGGTEYAGEIKKAMFSVMNYLLPREGVLSMHCSANVGRRGDTALFFGLSGTGKTTLSADPHRHLIGDDEHGWSDHGIFNIEGGCYAKVIGLSRKAEPEIYETTRRFGTILENVVIDGETRRIDLHDAHWTENTRAAYPLSQIPNSVAGGTGGHPRTLIFLTADAFGVLPPVSRLTREQAMYHFLSGYTAKVAGTEVGVKEPKATFSTCFASPFLMLPPNAYAELLGERVANHDAEVWLINTGWTGGPYGVGHRVPIAYTRAMIDAVLGGTFAAIPSASDPVFGTLVPRRCPGVPDELLQPRSTWQDPDAYDRQARALAVMFKENFHRFASMVSPEVRAAAPTTE